MDRPANYIPPSWYSTWPRGAYWPEENLPNFPRVIHQISGSALFYEFSEASTNPSLPLLLLLYLEQHSPRGSIGSPLFPRRLAAFDRGRVHLYFQSGFLVS